MSKNFNVPRPEHPEPQLRRDAWVNLNGKWQFEMDCANEGKYKKWEERTDFKQSIIVPFAPESELSGIGHKGYMDAVWYRRKLNVPTAWKGKRVILHFGAVDQDAYVYVNGKFVGEHHGGWWNFKFDITDFLNESDNYVTVRAEDDIRNGKYGGGKQSKSYYSAGCHYTRTTGIWQTVWMEAVDATHIDYFRLTPDIGSSSLNVELNTSVADDVTLTAVATFNGAKMGTATVNMPSHHTAFTLKLRELYLWDLGQGNLYDLKLTLKKKGKVIDTVYTYFGMRSVDLKDGKFLLNGKSVFGRFVLDQGFYKDGILTAPSVDRFEQDIRLSMEMGFNGARFHEKVFEPLALYTADKMGYMVWDEYPDWGIHVDDFTCLARIIPDWLSEIKRDYNHPSIIGWCCLNETWDRKDGNQKYYQDDRMLATIYDVVKSQDMMRPVIDTSGNFHVKTDTYDIHWYEQNPEIYAKNYAENPYYDNWASRQTYNGTPYWVSEYGGIKVPGFSEGSDAWGYGNAPKDRDEFFARYKGLTDVLLDNPKCWALCYTQLYDVEQEQNGLYNYDRTDKFTPEEKTKLCEIMGRRAAVEK